MPTTPLSHARRLNGTTVEHYWELSSDEGRVSLTLIHSTDAPFAGVAERSALVGDRTASSDDGLWVFGVFNSHRTTYGTDWPCNRHGIACEVDAFATHLAEPAWQRLRTGGVTDERVYAELQPLFAIEFGEVSA